MPFSAVYFIIMQSRLLSFSKNFKYDLMLKLNIINIYCIPKIRGVVFYIYLYKNTKNQNIFLIVESLLLLLLISNNRPKFTRKINCVHLQINFTNKINKYTFLEEYIIDILQREKRFFGLIEKNFFQNNIILTSFFLSRFKQLSSINLQIFNKINFKQFVIKVQIQTNTQNLMLNKLIISTILIPLNC